jgi:hypothetical protein
MLTDEHKIELEADVAANMKGVDLAVKAMQGDYGSDDYDGLALTVQNASAIASSQGVDFQDAVTTARAAGAIQ